VLLNFIPLSLGKSCANPANQAINKTTPNNKRNNNDITLADTTPPPVPITPDDITKESEFQSPEAFLIIKEREKMAMCHLTAAMGMTCCALMACQ
jgi:hypothetical protein